MAFKRTLAALLSASLIAGPAWRAAAESPRDLADFVVLLIPDLQLPGTHLTKDELTGLIAGHQELAKKIAPLRTKFYDPKTHALSPDGAKFAQRIRDYIAAQAAQSAQALQFLDRIASADPSSSKPFDSLPVIRKIDIDVRNVFDLGVPGENWWVFRAANAIHMRTKKEVIERELLCHEGDRLDLLCAIETERNLRALPFIKSAEITQMPVEDGKTDLKVKVQDSWTTQAEASFASQGGQRTMAVGALEQNLFGRGKSLSLRADKTADITQEEARYVDPQLFGSRNRLIAQYAPTSIGRQAGLDLYKPFYQLASETSYGAVTSLENRTVRLYSYGNETSNFHRKHDFEQANYGWKLDGRGDSAQRLNVAYRYEDYQYQPTDGTASGTLPGGRRMSGPSAAYSWYQADFIKERNVNGMEHPEDFNLGHELTVEAGVMPRALGSDRDRASYGLSGKKGVSWGPGTFLIAQMGALGFIRDGNVENGLFYGNATFFKNLSPAAAWPQTLALHAEAALSKSLYGDNQMRLGGDTGLRGYKVDFLSGDQSAYASAEYRVVRPQEMLHLFRVGAAAFVDTGSVVMGEAGNLLRGGWKTDAGVGLRLAPSRSANATALRFDVARALSDAGASPHWVVSIKGGMAFNPSVNNAIQYLLGDSETRLAEDSAGARSEQRRK